jgi:protein-disulfide reductase (glutathione)
MQCFRSLIAVAMFLMPVAALAAADHADLFNGAEINWRDTKTGIYEASKSGKPVIMVLHATWCSACKRYRAVFKDPGVVAASKDFVMILVDADKEKEINGAFSPDGTYVPRTLFIDSEGSVSEKFIGNDPKYPHTIDADNPAELLALMIKAKAADFGRPPQVEAPNHDVTTEPDQKT